MRKLVLAMALAATAGVAPAFADDDKTCTKAPTAEWLSADALKTKLGEQGYKVGKIEIEDGCAEVKATDKDGRRVELYVDPATGTVVKTDD